MPRASRWRHYITDYAFMWDISLTALVTHPYLHTQIHPVIFDYRGCYIMGSADNATVIATRDDGEYNRHSDF